MKNILARTFKVLGRAYESLIPDEETARRMGEQFINMYGYKADTKTHR